MAAEFVKLCKHGTLEEVQAALQSGVDVNSRDEFGLTGLMWSLKRRHTGVANLLLEQEGIDIDICDNWDHTALHYAAEDDQKSECLAKLLARTSSVNQRDCCGGTPLHRAVFYNAVSCVQLLTSDKRTDLNIKNNYGYTPLMLAVKDNHVACVKLLLSDERTDPNIKDNHGNSPLMLAVKQNQVGFVELLLADPRVDLMTRDRFKRSKRNVKR